MKLVKVPLDRVGAIIGKKGEVKKTLVERTGIDFGVDSETGDVMLDTSNAKEPLLVMKVEEVIKAIGRGFAPEKAYRLLDDEIYLQVLDIHDYVGKSQKHIRRVKARIIGKNGKTRKIIEDMTGAVLSIYGGTVAIIGDLNGLEVSRTAVDMILKGSEHSTVYKFLERKRRESKLAQLDSIMTGGSEDEEEPEEGDGKKDVEDLLDDLGLGPSGDEDGDDPEG